MNKTIINFCHTGMVPTKAIVSNLVDRIGLEDNIWYNEARTKKATNFDLLKRIHLLLDIFEKKIRAPKIIWTTGLL